MQNMYTMKPILAGAARSEPATRTRPSERPHRQLARQLRGRRAVTEIYAEIRGSRTTARAFTDIYAGVPSLRATMQPGSRSQNVVWHHARHRALLIPN
eukprot:7040941-Prymnesium_polylepis.1